MFPFPSHRWVFLSVISMLPGTSRAKWVEGRVDTKDNWAFLARFCFLSIEGQFEYLIEFDKDMGVPNLLLYYDDDSQWPSVYHSSKVVGPCAASDWGSTTVFFISAVKQLCRTAVCRSEGQDSQSYYWHRRYTNLALRTCKEREAVLNKNGQNQIIRLSHWYPDTEYSGCIITKENKELPASKSTTTSTTQKPSTKSTTVKPKNTTNSTKQDSPLPSFYDQFLKTTSQPKTTITDNSTTWFEVFPTEGNFTEDDLWENIEPERVERNGSHFENLKDVELLFDNRNGSGHKIKRSTDLYERFRRRRLKSESENLLVNRGNTERLVVSCHNSRRFRSARERWWFIAISNCDSAKGLDVKYKFLMTNGPDGDFWHEHFSADETYVLPILLSYTFAYVILMVAVVMCSVELKSRHLLHSTYKLFLISIVAQHCGVMLQTMAYLRYAANGVGAENAKITGQFLCGMSEMTFLLLLILMAKGYTITRGRLKVGFTVKLTVFVCCYFVTYIVLFVYQAKAFDPGEVLYLYESPAGYGIIVLRIVAWCAFAYSTFFTVKKYPEKNMFYCPFMICGTLWFHAGSLFILTANSYIDKWVRESVVIAVLLFITFCGHIMFLLLTLPVFANKNFPYHVRTTQIGVMEVTGNTALDSFGHNAYHPGNGAPQTVIIPLTRRTEELIGNMYSQYMATAPPLSLENETPKLNGISKTKTLSPQDSTETNTSDDIKPYVKGDKEIFTVESQMTKIESQNSTDSKTEQKPMLPHEKINLPNENSDSSLPTESLTSLELSRSELPSILRSRRNILEPIKREDVPSWSLAKGPSVVAMQKKKSVEVTEPSSSPNGSLNGVPSLNGTLLLKKVPPVRNGLQASSGEISTIHEGHVQSYMGSVSKATIDLFSAGSKG